MEDQTISAQYALLANRLSSLAPSKRLLLGISGAPGSGKSRVAEQVQLHFGHQRAVIVGMDGWHFSRAQLARMPDPQLATERRGAPWTFNSKAYASFVQCLREPIRPDRVLKAPSFSHADKDPVDDGIAVHPHHRLVIIEGAYCNVDEAPWSKAAELLDERWLVEADELECRQRLIKRHLSAGICVDEADAIKRVETNDLPNGQYILAHIFEPVKRLPNSVAVASWQGIG